jgi:aerobic carbon-monoxide dehydrogenase medium subunit
MAKSFQYQRPTTIAEACELKTEYGASARFLAGGTDLILNWQRGSVDFKHCIDLTFIPDFNHINQTDTEIRIGTLATLAAIEAAGVTGNGLLGALGNVAQQMCTPQVRTLATIGGNLCNASPAADLPVLLMVLDARVTLAGAAGERTVEMAEFFTGVNRTVLKDDEVLSDIRIPLPGLKAAYAYERATRVVVDCNQTNAAVALSLGDDGIVAAARISLGAVAPVPIRAKAAEKMLVGTDVANAKKDMIARVSDQAAAETRPISDLRASADYRKEISRVLVKRCIESSIVKLEGVIS